VRESKNQKKKKNVLKIYIILKMKFDVFDKKKYNINFKIFIHLFLNI